jgi:Fuc2NAc and GlcNAc transferase
LTIAANAVGTVTAAVVAVALTSLLSAALTARVAALAARCGVVDQPGGRRHHARPTPRGGGLAIVLVVLAVALALAWAQQAPRWPLAVLGAGGLVALVGGLDDVVSVRAPLRLLAHLTAAFLVAALAWLPEARASLAVASWSEPAAVALVTLLLGWTLNALNFMDGVDGLASGYALVVAGGLLLCAAFAVGDVAPSTGWWALTLAIFAASAGFLRHNWSPAAVFLGDVGSGFLGFVLLALALWADAAGALPLGCFLLLMAPFYVDTGWTLLRRALRLQPIWRAHSEHVFHQLLRRRWSHRAISGAYLGVGGLWCLPLAMAVARAAAPSALLMTAGYLPLFALAIGLGGGRPAPSGSGPLETARPTP